MGKGITTASLSAILQAKGYRVSPVKVDMYLNIDAGTIRPQEHGEVFVTDDGIETDQDLGHYERFTDLSLSKANYITTGQVYQEVLNRERAFEYDGEDVEAIPHVTNEIIRRIKLAGSSMRSDITIVEYGGTVGEYQNALFFEAYRIMKLKGQNDVIHIHVAYLPIPNNIGEMKSKPVQQSVRILNSMGIQPDFIVGRASHPIDKRRRERIALFCNVSDEEVISNPDVPSIYEVPLVLSEQKFGEKILAKLGLDQKEKDLREWELLVETIKSANKAVNIGVVGKYFATGDYQLEDVYVSVIESIKHACWANKVKPKLFWIDSEKIEENGAEMLEGMAGIVVPGGFGSRGTEGMIEAIKFVREAKVPFLGLCYGMQMATIEFARNVLGLKGANTTEVDTDSPHPVIHIMPSQEKKLLVREYGATMRLGAWDCVLEPKTKAYQAYGRKEISERHRHRYELNNRYKERLIRAGFLISGASPDGHLAEIIELRDHPFFVGTQFHPEFKSRPTRGHPLFNSFLRATLKS